MPAATLFLSSLTHCLLENLWQQPAALILFLFGDITYSEFHPVSSIIHGKLQILLFYLFFLSTIMYNNNRLLEL